MHLSRIRNSNKSSLFVFIKIFLYIGISITVMQSCQKTTSLVVKNTTVLDTPEYHLNVAERLLKKQAAETDIQKKAYFLQKADDEYAKSKTLIGSKKAPANFFKVSGTLSLAKKDYSTALSMYESDYKVNTNLESCMMAGRIYQDQKQGKEWPQKAEVCFNTVIGKEYTNAEAHFRLGRLYFEILDFQQSKTELQKLVKKQTVFQSEANKLLGEIFKLEKISMADPCIKYLGAQQNISKAELAFIFNKELLPEFKVSNKSKNSVIPSDIKGNLYENEIQENIRVGLMNADEGNLFHPEVKVTRIMAARIFYEMNRIRNSSRKQEGVSAYKASPFNDMLMSHPDFRSAEFSVTHKLMAPDSSGFFYPEKEINGMELLNAVTVFKEYLSLIVEK